MSRNVEQTGRGPVDEIMCMLQNSSVQGLVFILLRPSSPQEALWAEKCAKWTTLETRGTCVLEGYTLLSAYDGPEGWTGTKNHT